MTSELVGARSTSPLREKIARAAYAVRPAAIDGASVPRSWAAAKASPTCPELEAAYAIADAVLATIGEHLVAGIDRLPPLQVEIAGNPAELEQLVNTGDRIVDAEGRECELGRFELWYLTEHLHDEGRVGIPDYALKYPVLVSPRAQHHADHDLITLDHRNQETS